MVTLIHSATFAMVTTTIKYKILVAIDNRVYMLLGLSVEYSSFDY
jgi:hypothetical protein